MSEHTPGIWQAAQRIRRECKTGHSAQHWAAIIAEETAAECDRLREALEAERALIRKAQDLLATHIVPDSRSDDAEVINELYGIFDGPEQRAARDKSRAALAGTAPSEAEKLREINGELVEALKIAQDVLPHGFKYEGPLKLRAAEAHAVLTVRAALAKAREAQP